MLNYETNKEDFMDFMLAELGVYETKKINYNDAMKDANSKQIYRYNDTCYKFEKRELTEKDRLYIKLKEIEIQKDNNRYLAKLSTIKNILVFYLIITIIGFLWIILSMAS